MNTRGKLNINKHIKPKTSDVSGIEDMSKYSYIPNTSAPVYKLGFLKGAPAPQEIITEKYVPRVPQVKNYLENTVELAKSRSKSKVKRGTTDNNIRNIIENRNREIATMMSVPPPPASASVPATSYADIVKKIKKEEPVTKRCYTCKPRGKVMMHIISTSACGDFLFHHDMNNRPIILVTPILHVEKISDLPNDIQVNLLKSVEDFCKFWSITSYEVSYNVGEWQKNEHVHIKIKMKEKQISRMRDDHFRLMNLRKQYDMRV